MDIFELCSDRGCAKFTMPRIGFLFSTYWDLNSIVGNMHVELELTEEFSGMKFNTRNAFLEMKCSTTLVLVDLLNVIKFIN